MSGPPIIPEPDQRSPERRALDEKIANEPMLPIRDEAYAAPPQPVEVHLRRLRAGVRQVAQRPLWIGHAGSLRDARPIMETGIQAVMELADSEPLAQLPRDLVRLRLPLSDGGENPPWMISLACDSAAALLRAQVPTLVCCSGGMSRSVCVAAAAIALVDGVSLREALPEVVGSGPADVSPGLLMQFQEVMRV